MYRFSGYEFDPHQARLQRHGTPINLEPQGMRLLAYLIDHRDRIVSKDELIREIWDDRAITDAALNTRIRSIRRALGDDRSSQSFLRTFPKRGFRFVGAIDGEAPPDADAAPRRKFLLAGVVALGVVASVAGILAHLFPGSDTPAGLALPDRPSLAVVSFDNLGDAGREQHFVNGLTEDLTMHLSRYRELFVISSATIASYAAQGTDSVELARELGVAYVVRGSVRRNGDHVRVRSELIDIAAGETVWAEHFDSEMTDLFKVQDEISRAVVGRLVPQLVEAGAARLVGRPTDSLGAWDLYLRALSRQADFSEGAQLETVRLARMAIALDDRFAAAHSLLARALGTVFFFGWTDTPEETLAQANDAARQAIELDDRDAVAYAALGYIQRFAGEAEPAIANLERAAALNPNDARIRLELAHTLDWFRLQERALPQIELAIRLSPRDPLLQNMYFYKGHILFHLGRHEEALDTARLLAAVATSDTWKIFHHLLRAANLAEMDRTAEARAAIDHALAINPRLSQTTMRAQFEGSKNHPENRRLWLESLAKAGLPR
jgi:TolB-like protein/DNA-binding winged helix-turn-helix (wHTH) protein/Flp pilus assembly protein TadD